MIAIAKTKAQVRDEALQKRFVAMLPIIVGCARVAFRNLAIEAREEALQETVATAWTDFMRLADRGKLDVCFPTILAMFSIRQVRAGRQVGSRLNSCDVSSRYAQRRNGFQVQRLDHIDEHENSWKEIIIADRRASPADLAATRIDFADWLKLLPGQRRKIALLLAGGEATSFVANKFGISAARISQIRLWLKRNWEGFQGEAEAVTQPQLSVAQ